MFSVSFYNRFFYPDISATSQILTELVLGLKGKGINIKVFCSDACYLGGKIESNDIKINGIVVNRFRTTSFGRSNRFYRYLDFLSYLSNAMTNMFFDNSDVLVFFTDPPLLNVFGSMFSKLRGKKKVIVLQDFFPYTSRAVNIIDDGLVYNILDKQTVFSLNLSDRVVVLSEKMAEFAISRGIKSSKVIVIHNWADKTIIKREIKKDKKFMDRYNIRDKDFVILYSGNIGLGHEFDTILNTIPQLENAILLFVGDGPKKEYIKKKVVDNDLKNVKFYPYVDKRDLSASLSIADVHIVTQLPEVVGLNMPSKLYGCMASGRPICFIGSLNSDVANIINWANCGASFNIGDITGIKEFIQKLTSNPNEKEKMGINGREYFERKFDKEIAIEKYYKILNDVYNS